MDSSRRTMLKKTALILPTLMTVHVSQVRAQVSGAPTNGTVPTSTPNGQVKGKNKGKKR